VENFGHQFFWVEGSCCSLALRQIIQMPFMLVMEYACQVWHSSLTAEVAEQSNAVLNRLKQCNGELDKSLSETVHIATTVELLA